MQCVLYLLIGLESGGITSYPWYVHQYPFPHDARQDPCRVGVTGDRYDPLGANDNDITYSDQCASNQSLCEVGDLSGRHGPLNTSSSIMEFTDNLLSLYGVYTIIGRTVVLFANGAPFACANIDYPPSGTAADTLYVPFRGDFTGNVYFLQHTNNGTASVYTDLSSIGGLQNSVGHNWHVHQNPLDSTGNNCGVTGPHFNPRNVDALSEIYDTLCSPATQMQCEVGDLSNKGAPLDVKDRIFKQFYTDLDLPLSGQDASIANRSIVIHEANGGPSRISCANISRFFPLEAVAIFNSQSGISGSIRFIQLSPFGDTKVDVNLVGLGNMAGGYHVHIGPTGPVDLGFPERCDGSYTGGHWNPLNVDYTGQVPVTSDDYEVGDLSGKFGSLANLNAVYQTFRDPNLPLFESFGIIGRSVVIHRDDAMGTRWVCADIVHARPTVTFSYNINTSSVEGMITLTQTADDPYSATTIIVTLRVKEPLGLPSTSDTPSRTPPSLSSSEVSASSVAPFLTTTPIVTPTQDTSMGLFPSPEFSLIPTSVLIVDPTPSPTSSSILLEDQGVYYNAYPLFVKPL